MPQCGHRSASSNVRRHASHVHSNAGELALVEASAGELAGHSQILERSTLFFVHHDAAHLRLQAPRVPPMQHSPGSQKSVSGASHSTHSKRVSAGDAGELALVETSAGDAGELALVETSAGDAGELALVESSAGDAGELTSRCGQIFTTASPSVSTMRGPL